MAIDAKRLANIDVDVRTNFQLTFEDRFGSEENWFPELSTELSTEKRTITQAFVFDNAKIEETQFGQPPRYRQIGGQEQEIELKIYDDGLNLDAYNMAADNLGLFVQRANMMGERAALHPKDLAVDVLVNGDTSAYNIWDGQPFFSNTHPKQNGVNIDNLLSGTLDATNYQAARTQMRRFASDSGTDDVMNILPTHTVVPPELEITLKQIVQNTMTAADNKNTENVLVNTSKPIVEAKLTDANDWFVLSNDRSVSPFILIRHSQFGNFDLHSETGDDDPSFRDHHVRRWWIRAVMRVWPSRPELMIKVVN